MSEQRTVDDVIDAVRSVPPPASVWAADRLSPRDVHNIWGRLTEAGFLVGVLTLRGPGQVKDQALGQLARAFNFPGWFGWNWDAADECLIDVDPDSGPFCVLVTRPDETFNVADQGDWQALMSALEWAAERWSGRAIQFTVVVV